MKVARTVLTGGKLERAYLSELGRGLYYGSYQNPRTLVWTIGTVIFLLMIITAFLGYAFSLYRYNIYLYSNESTLCLTLPTIICLTLPIIIGSSGTGDKITKLHPNYVTGFSDGEATLSLLRNRLCRKIMPNQVFIAELIK